MSDILDLSWKCKDCAWCMGIEDAHGLCLVDGRLKNIYRERNPTMDGGYYFGIRCRCGGCPVKRQFQPASAGILRRTGRPCATRGLR